LASSAPFDKVTPPDVSGLEQEVRRTVEAIAITLNKLLV